ncbi:MAG: TetR/AcrR family transcriptional regulator, partial [Chthoniobacterales bacterium]
MKRRAAAASGSSGRLNNGVTKKGRSTRLRVLKAGRRVVEKRGYFDASVTEITEESGVALGTFYRYFDNKDELFLELLNELVSSLYHSVSGSWVKGDELRSLRISSQRYLQAYYENRKLIAAMIQMAGAVPDCA